MKIIKQVSFVSFNIDSMFLIPLSLSMTISHFVSLEDENLVNKQWSVHKMVICKECDI